MNILRDFHNRGVPFILDGGMGSQLSKLGMGNAKCPEELLLLEPEKVAKVHRMYFEAGSNAVETNSFGGTRIKLAEFGLENKVYEINKKAAEIAKSEAIKFNGYVVGSIGPSGVLLSSNDKDLSNKSFDEVREMFKEQIIALIDGGIDLLSIETQQDILETKCAILAAYDAMKMQNKKIPIIAHLTLDSYGRMLLGTPMQSALYTVDALGVDAIGINCSTGPVEMETTIRFMSENSRCLISVMPNAGIPINKDGVAFFPLEPEGFANEVYKLISKYKIDIIGGCCGTTPDHIRALKNKLNTLTNSKRDVKFTPSLSSSLKSISLIQEPAPLVIGERMNAQGSKAMKEVLNLALENHDYSKVREIAEDQVRFGAHALDLCVARKDLNEEVLLMTESLRALRLSNEAPLMFDTIHYDVAKSAFQNYPGKPIWNSINLEHGEEEFRKKMALGKEFGVSLVCLCIDEKGLAKTKERKLEIAERMLKIAAEYSYEKHDLAFDFLTFSLATGQEEFRNFANETLETIKEFKLKHKECHTVLGVSNISFGLKPNQRKILNSIFFYHAVKAGLSLAIINAKEVIPYLEIEKDIREKSENLIFNKNQNALAEFINLDANVSIQNKNEAFDYDSLEPGIALQQKLLRRDSNNINELIVKALKNHTALNLINNFLLTGMKEIGERFGRGELILPYVLESAEVMKRIMDVLEQYIDKKDSAVKGTLLLATVYGDIHDIGKNLVKSIIENNGYKVIDLGKNVTIETLIENIKIHKPMAVGLSALLVSTSNEMLKYAEKAKSLNIETPILVGGAAIDNEFAAKIISNTKLPVFYCKDAFDGLFVLNKLASSESNEFIKNHLYKMSSIEKGSTKASSQAQFENPSLLEPVTPPFIGVKHVLSVNKEIFKDKFQNEIIELFEPKFSYGYFYCKYNETKDVLDVFSKEKKLIETIKFPQFKTYAPLSHYFKTEGDYNVVPFFICTIGEKLDDLSTEDFNKGSYKDGLKIHQIKARAAELLAEYVHNIINGELNLNIGKRYSPGYPAWKDLSDQRKLFTLLAPEKIGITLSDTFQMKPEGSVSAVLVPHKDAKY